MFTIILTASPAFLATLRTLASELPQIGIDTARVQELALRPGITQAEARHICDSYINSGRYDKVELIYREE